MNGKDTSRPPRARRPADHPPRRIGPATRARLWAALAALLTVAAGLALRGVADGPVAKYGGDALYTLLLYELVLVAAPRTRPWPATCVALAVSWAIEFFQLTGIPAQLATHSTLARLVAGTSFNPPDLLWYAAGAALGQAIHRASARTLVARAPRAGGQPSASPSRRRR